jgi:hypothetical protein
MTMLTREVPPDILMYPYGEDDTVVVDCGGGYCAVKRPHEAWAMEKNPDHDWQFKQFLNGSNKTEQLKDVMRSWEAEYKTFVKDGSVLAGPGYYPYYISTPDFFEKDISWVMQFKGELSAADQAWIKNSKDLIEKYHALYEEKIQKIYCKGRANAPGKGKGDSDGFINQT